MGCFRQDFHEWTLRAIVAEQDDAESARLKVLADVVTGLTADEGVDVVLYGLFTKAAK